MGVKNKLRENGFVLVVLEKNATILWVDSLSILFHHRSFQKPIFPLDSSERRIPGKHGEVCPGTTRVTFSWQFGLDVNPCFRKIQTWNTPPEHLETTRALRETNMKTQHLVGSPINIPILDCYWVGSLDFNFWEIKWLSTHNKWRAFCRGVNSI